MDQIGGLANLDSKSSYRGAIVEAIKDQVPKNPHTLVVVAGYAEGCAKFLSLDIGLPDRFSKRVEFSDYSAGELLQIAIKKVPLTHAPLVSHTNVHP